MLYKVHQLLVIAILLIVCSSVQSKHCTLDAMRLWAEEACESLRGIQFRDRRDLNSRVWLLAPGSVKIRRDSFPHSGYLKTTQSAAMDLHHLDLNPKYHVLGSASHSHRFRRYKRDDEDNRITHYCCQRECGVFTGC
ncbi:hypothetical protein ACFFRR_011586 [Megaselia abdita]